MLSQSEVEHFWREKKQKASKNISSQFMDFFSKIDNFQQLEYLVRWNILCIIVSQKLEL